MRDADRVVLILLVDAEAAIHGDFREILARAQSTAVERRAAGELFDDPIVPAEALRFEVATAARGEDGLELLRAGNAAGQPYTIAFVAARTQSGWGGVETTRQFWQESPDLQVVLCIESIDYSWREMVRQLGVSDRLLILHKPFEEIEVLQLAHSLARKWQLAAEVRSQLERLTTRVAIRTGELERANTQLRVEMAERISALEALRRAQKMEVVGALAAGVAHEFNNVLTVIQGHLSLQLTRGAFADDARASIETAFAASERAAALIRRLLISTRQQVIAREPLDLVAALTNTRALLDRTLGEQIVQRWELPSERPTIAAEAGAIEQIVLNLALNARDAMPGGGTLSLRLEILGETARLSVTDTGAGIAPENLALVFDPFFTTKMPGLSTGLGLAVVFAITEKLEARIEVESPAGGGATFRVHFPIIATTRLEETPAAFITPSDRTRTILVAEDEEMLVLLLQGILTSCGYEVLTAPDGPTALKVWAERGDGIDLLLTDMVMPGGISGRVLGEKLQAEDPRLRVIYTSGYSPDFTGGDLVLTPGVNFLPKPYTSRAVLEIVQRMFNAAP